MAGLRVGGGVGGRSVCFGYLRECVCVCVYACVHVGGRSVCF